MQRKVLEEEEVKEGHCESDIEVLLYCVRNASSTEIMSRHHDSRAKQVSRGLPSLP